MKRLLLSAFAVLVVGCASKKTVTMEIPPQMELGSYQTIGVYTFGSNGDRELRELITQEFANAIQAAQPQARVIELGQDAEIYSTPNRPAPDRMALRAMKEQQGIDAVVLGRLTVEKAKPGLFKKPGVGVDANASLVARMVATDSAATVWTGNSKLKTNIPHAHFDERGNHLAATDPTAAYGHMVDTLAHNITDEFRVHYVTRKAHADELPMATVNEPSDR